MLHARFVFIFLFLICRSLGQSIVADKVFDNELYESVLDSELCQRHLEAMNILQFYDASFRIPSSIMEGNLVDYGNYYQCLGISETSGDLIIEGKHCMVSLPKEGDVIEIPGLPQFGSGIKLNVTRPEGRNLDIFSSFFGSEISRSDIPPQFTQLVYLGVCIPKTCTAEEALARYFDNSLFKVNFVERHCRLPNDKPFVAGDYVAIVVFSLIGFITILSTGYEIRHVFILKKDRKQLHQIYSCCSVYTNTKRLFTFGPIPGALDCVDGIRALSILWVIIGHTLLLMTAIPMRNAASAYKWGSEIQALWLRAANISVDTFLTLSGVLLVYTSTNKLTQVGLLKNLHLFYLNRILRILPILMVGVLLQSTIFFHADDGANWPLEGHLVQICREKWWITLLHIQNYYGQPIGFDECLPHSWYLAVDMQLYIISPVVLFWALGSRRSGWTGLTIATLTSFSACTLYVFLVFAERNTNYSTYYVNTLTRAPPFFIGMMVGYLLHVYRANKIQLSMVFVYASWLVTLVAFGLVISAYYPTIRPDRPSDLYTNITFSINRSVWALALGWMIFACAKGYGGPINWFLSLTMFKFIARISYALYIFHYPMQFITTASAIEPIYFSVKNIWLGFIRDLATSMLVAVIVCIIIDAPSSTLQKHFLGGAGQKKTQPKKDESATIGINRNDTNGKQASIMPAEESVSEKNE